MKVTTILALMVLCFVGVGWVEAESSAYPDPWQIPEVASFLGSDGVGEHHPDAPGELAHFGRLVGIWEAEQEVMTQSGTWASGAPALWIWQYVLGGFAIQDLWLHTADQLPDYLGDLGRSYQLTSLRSFDVAAGDWKTAWAANGSGQGPGQDFGTFVATEEEGRVVMLSESSYGTQRVTFASITDDSFEWTSGCSGDVSGWMMGMRVRARRRE